MGLCVGVFVVGVDVGEAVGEEDGAVDGTELDAKEGLADSLMVGDILGKSDGQGVSLSPK